jgi:hypothetical protein
MIDDAVFRRIRKCLALADSPVPAEAAAAMRQAQKLMALHNIDAHAIDMSSVAEVNVRSKASISTIKQWEVELLALIEKAFGVKYLWRHSFSYKNGSERFGSYMLIGMRHQLPAAEYALKVLQRKLGAQRTKYLRCLEQVLYRKNKTALADNFCLGWIHAIEGEVVKFVNQPGVDKLVEEYKNKKSAGECEAKKSDGSDVGYVDGMRKGKKERLYRPMETAVGSKLIGTQQ